MKKKLLYIAIIQLIISGLSSNLFAQTNGTLTFTFTQTSQSPTYSGTRNALAVWIKSGSGSGGAFIKTKMRYAGRGQGTSDHLPTFAVAAGGAANNCLGTTVNVTDATTGATLTSFGTRSITWDGTDVNGTTVADGTYSVAIEECWNHGSTGIATAYFSFTKGTSPVSTTFPNTSQFSNITLTWTPVISNTLSTGTINGSPFCSGQVGIGIPYTATGTFNSGNVFTAQLSDANGSFASPTTIGTLTSTSLSGTITTNVPLPNTPRNAYRIRVVASNPSTTGTDNGVNLTINAAPAPANAGPAQTVCTSATLTLAGNTPSVGSGTWTRVSGAGNITSPSNPASTVTGLGTGANTFRWTISNATCTSTSDVIVTGVAAPTTANAGQDQILCNASSASLAGNTPATGTGAWSLVSGAGNITNSSSATTTVTGLGIGSNTFRWTISNTPCPASTDEVIITSAAAPTVANAGPDQTVCATSATLEGNTAASGTGTWTRISGTGTITTPSSPTSTVTGLGAGMNTFRWTISSVTCGVSTDDVVITQSGNLTTANAGPDQSVCANFATLSGNTPAVGSGTWTRISGSGTITSPGNTITTVTGLGVGPNTFRWNISNPPCAASTDDVVITGVANPTLSNAGPDQNVCATSVTLSGNTPTNGTGTWIRVSGSGTITTPSSASTTVTGLGVGANTFRWTITNPPCSESTDDVVITQAGTLTVANAGPDQTVCNNSAVTLAGNTPVSGTGTWTLINGAGIITSPSSATSTITELGPGPNTFRWTISNGACTPSTDEVIITGVVAPTIANAGPDQSACAASTTLAGNMAASGTGIWTLVSGTGTITNPSSPTTTVTGLGNGSNVFRWTISSTAPCTSSFDEVTINNNCITNTITTNGISGSPFCSSTSYSLMVSFSTTGTFSGYYTAELSDASGNFTNPIAIGASSSSPISAVIPSYTTPGTGYRIRVSNTSPAISGSDNGSDLSINTCVANSITTGVISGGPFCSNTSYGLQVPFTYSGIFSGFFTAELSDAAGSFAHPVVIGYGTGDPIPATIPSNTAPGSNYRIRVLNSSPATTGSDNGKALEINSCMAVITGSISETTFPVNGSYTLEVPFTTIGSLSGPFIVELSDVSGSFANPITIGYGSSSPIFATIPASADPGNSYRIRVIDYSYGVEGSDNGVNISINTNLVNGLFNSNYSNAVSVYPNPNPGNFNVRLPFSGSADISVANILGETVYQKSVIVNLNDPYVIDIANIAKGAYILKVQTEDKIYQTTMMVY